MDFVLEVGREGLRWAGAERHAPAALERLKAELPGWAAQVALLGKAEVGGLDWWWLTTFSELNALRTPLFQQLYWLLLADCELAAGGYTRAVLRSEVPGLGEPWRALGEARGLTVEVTEPSLPPRPGFLGVVKQAVKRIGKWALLRGKRPARCEVALVSIYPNLYREGKDTLLGDWQEVLERHGRAVLGLAQVTRRGPLPGGVTAWESWLSLADIVRIALDWRLPLAWWRRRAEVPRFCGWPVSGLTRMALDRELLVDLEAWNAAVLSVAVRNLARAHPELRAVCVTLENQPRDRAVAAGVAGTTVRAVGFQPSMYSSTHLPWFTPASVHYALAYGTRDFERFGELVGRTRTALPGAVRYGRLAAVRARERRPEGLIFVALTVDPQASRAMLEAARLVAGQKGLRVAARCHPVNPLPLGGVEEVSDLYEAILRADLMVTGVSCVAVEALALGCVPVIYGPPGGLEPFPLRDHPDLLVACADPRALAAALERYSEAGPREALVRRWREVEEEVLSGLDGQAGERAYEALEGWGIL